MNHYFKHTCFIILLACAPEEAMADFVGKKGATLPDPTKVNCSFYVEPFTVTTAGQYRLYFTSEYTADAVVLSSQANVDSFARCGSYNYVAGFNGSYGQTASFTLQPGSYAVGVRNSANTTNHYSFELELVPPAISEATFYDQYIQRSNTVKPGQLYSQPFTIQDGFQYVIEGCNSGSMDVFILPPDQLSNFTNKLSYKYYSNYGGSNDPNEPGLATLNLSPGDYILVYRNNHATIAQTITYTLYRYRETNYTTQSNKNTSSNTSAIGTVHFENASSISLNNSLATLSVDRIVNERTTSTGTLYLNLRLTATNNVYASGYNLGSIQLGSLPGNNYYYGIERTISTNEVPAGQYYVHLVLTEYPDLTTVVDSVTMSNKVTITSNNQPNNYIDNFTTTTSAPKTTTSIPTTTSSTPKTTTSIQTTTSSTPKTTTSIPTTTSSTPKTTSSVTPTTSVRSNTQTPVLDVDKSGTVDATDGVLLLRKLNGASTIDTGVMLPTGQTNATLLTNINTIASKLDVDQNGSVDATDGVLILRKLNGASTIDTGVVLPTGQTNSKVVTNIENIMK
ncbi:MAG: hypothetical protein H7839_04085 [Magnetococcus sp. YQC-5]